jgi:hypothetical protein
MEDGSAKSICYQALAVQRVPAVATGYKKPQVNDRMGPTQAAFEEVGGVGVSDPLPRRLGRLAHEAVVTEDGPCPTVRVELTAQLGTRPHP